MILASRIESSAKTMGLLFLQLMNHMERMETNNENRGRRLLIEVYAYIEENYRDGELTELAGLLNYDVCWLSKEIKKRTGHTYTELVQEKRMLWLNPCGMLYENMEKS